MLQTVIRSSIERARIAEPRYSMTCPVPPPMPSRAITASTRSLAVTPGRSVPSMVTASVLGGCCRRLCVARTCDTSLVPIPNASAPNAPCVLVWLSPQTITSPGCVTPSSGPMTCTIPCPSVPSACSSTPKSAQFFSSAAICIAAALSRIGIFPSRPRGVVGVE